MPSQKELKWSQLKVGLLATAALAALTVLIFLMSGSTGGLFTHKLKFHAYFENANGLKIGAPVTLDGVTIGNVKSVQILPNHNPAAVEVVVHVGEKYLPSLHTDSTVAINQAGVLGDAFIDISSNHATGPQPVDGATLTVSGKPGISDVIASSQESIQSVNQVVKKVGILMDTLNTGKGTAGVMLNDPEVAKKIVLTISQLQAVTGAISSGKGSLGKLITDDELYNKANATIGKLNNIVADLDSGKGSAGKLLKDEKLYSNLNAAISNVNELLGGINAGKGSLGKLAKDPTVAQNLGDSLGRLNELLKGVNEGKGSLGQLVVNRQFYDNLDNTLATSSQLLDAIRKDPKKYLTIHVKVF
ncbi:MlaD family protein [Acidicapsa ligni]|uniref:MlaD family protein n=1 Tax=Acidicapsa ligni TaxID=542300 RepID=UPI0021E0C5D9|nr:MlaD family protein [Acidicapsa ligni]